MSFKPISPEEMVAKHMDDQFFYVINASADPPQVIANPFVDDMDELTYIFQEEEDATTFKYILERTPAYQDSKLAVERDTLRALTADIAEEMGRFKFAGITHEEAQRMFEHYDEVLKTRSLAEDPELHKPIRLEEE
jgi:hypothetical protein